MGEHTPTPWKIYDDADPHHVKILGRHQDIGNAHVADVLFPENAAFIVKACNAHDALVKALTDSRAAIASLPMEALGYASAENNQAHWPIRDELLHNIDEAIDEAIAKVRP